MGTVETRSKTSLEGSSPSPGNDKPRGSEHENKDLKEAVGALKRGQGVRFSSNGNGGLGDDADDGVVEVVKNRVVEAKISVQRDFGGRGIDISGANDCQGLGDSEMNGVSSLLKMRESGRSVIFSHGGGSDSAKKLDSVYASERRTRAANSSSGGNSSGIGVQGRLKRKKREVKESDEDHDGKIVTIDVPIAETSENKDAEEIDISDEVYGLSVGDFVWGKIKSHPWWPGRIYDPSDASDYALKLRQKNRLLVAYFGDGTFAWCHPSQLKPFEENFDDMVKQSSSRAFINAVQDAVNEVGRLLDLKMTNSCVAKISKYELAPLLAKNSGIKEGVLIPENGIEKLSTVLFEPAEVLSRVKKIAEIIAISSVLELEILKARLSAFYLSRGGCKLANYQVPQPILGLEDSLMDEAVDVGNSKGTVKAPVQGGPFEEDYFSLPVSPKFGETSHSPGTLGNRLHHRRKQKSIAEIMGEDNDLHTKYKAGDVTEVVIDSGKLVASSGRKKRKSIEDTVTTTTQVQKIEGMPPYSDRNVPSSENDGNGGKESIDKGILSHLKKKKENIGKNSSSGSKKETNEAPLLKEGNLSSKEAKEQIEKGYLSRERKKSKYLSPPFTNPSRGQRKGDKETASPKVSSEAQISERMTRDAGELLGSSPVFKSNGETIKENSSKEPDIEEELSDRLISQTPEEDKNKTIDLKKIQSPSGEVLSKVRSAAINPQIPREIDFLENILGFVTILRSSLYRHGSYYKVYNKRRPGRKRKNPESELGTLRKDSKDQNQADMSPNHDSEKRKRRKKETASDTPKQKQAAETKTGKKGTAENASAAALFVSFGPGSPLPSKSELITFYSKFGALNEAETDIFCNNYTARVHFLKTSDAEEAFNQSKKVSPFGSCSVNFRLRYLSAGSKSGEHGEKSQSKAFPAKKKDKSPAKPPASQSPVIEASKLNFIKQKLQGLTSMLEGLEGKSPDMKKKLESEMKGLLEDVNKMAESSSS